MQTLIFVESTVQINEEPSRNAVSGGNVILTAAPLGKKDCVLKDMVYIAWPPVSVPTLTTDAALIIPFYRSFWNLAPDVSWSTRSKLEESN